MYALLALHPHVRGSLNKEPHVFDAPKRYLRLCRGQGFPDSLPVMPLVEHAKQIIVDATPDGLEANDRCVVMAALVPAASRFVVLLRHPVDRMWSYESMVERRTYAKFFDKFVNTIVGARSLLLVFFSCCSRGPMANTLRPTLVERALQSHRRVHHVPRPRTVGSTRYKAAWLALAGAARWKSTRCSRW